MHASTHKHTRYADGRADKGHARMPDTNVNRWEARIPEWTPGTIPAETGGPGGAQVKLGS